MTVYIVKTAALYEAYTTRAITETYAEAIKIANILKQDEDNAMVSIDTVSTTAPMTIENVITVENY